MEVNLQCWVSGVASVIFGLMLVCLLLVKLWHTIAPHITARGLCVFLAGAVIATVSAQKRLYVNINMNTGDPVPPAVQETYKCDHTFKTITEAFEYLRFRPFSDVDIFVAPGVYPAVKVPYIEPCPNPSIPVQLVPYFDVTAIEGPESVVIDGAGNNAAVASSGQTACPRAWHGFVFSNAVYGAVGGCFKRCTATCCKVGFFDSYLHQCIAISNRYCGAEKCRLDHCLVVGNGGEADADTVFPHVGMSNCSVGGTIAWENFTAGSLSNWTLCNGGDGGPNCVIPKIQEGDIAADPLFRDSAHGDYQLQMGSPCINICYIDPWWYSEYDDFPYQDDWGIVDPWVEASIWPGVNPPKDYAGGLRCQRRLWDIGPFEYQPTNETQTITAPVPVEFAWIDERCPSLLELCGGDYDRVVLGQSANPIDISASEGERTYYSVWQSYLADLDPTDSNATFRATIEMDGDRPVVSADPLSPRRKYTIVGKQRLSDDRWTENCPGARFFKVNVGLK